MSARRARITTLKDVFPEIKKEYKRNFLRENKIKIKDIQKDVKTRKQVEKDKQDEVDKRTKKIQDHLARNSTRTANSKSLSDIGSVRRSKSSHSRITINNECACGGLKLNSPPLSAKSCLSIDKESQTDIELEEAYYNRKPLESSTENLLQDDDADNELLGMEDQLNIKNGNDEEPEIHSGRSLHRTYSTHDQRRESHNNPFINKIDYLKPYHKVPKSGNWNEQFKNLQLDDEISVLNSEIEKKKSARSIVSTNSNRSNIKLPKYLEKEKREKEFQRLRELEKDPDCPVGYAVLDEKIRLENLEVLRKGFQSLIDELNRLPMSSATLRVKNRRNEIEKDLADLENKIRFYEKPKIYVKCPTTTMD